MALVLINIMIHKSLVLTQLPENWTCDYMITLNL